MRHIIKFFLLRDHNSKLKKKGSNFGHFTFLFVVQLVTLEASFTILLRLPHLLFSDRQFVLDIVKSLLFNKVPR